MIKSITECIVKRTETDTGRISEHYVQDLVRCKDCRYWDVSYDDYAYGYCPKVSPGQNIVKEATWYCADGVRKNETDRR